MRLRRPAIQKRMLCPSLEARQRPLMKLLNRATSQRKTMQYSSREQVLQGNILVQREPVKVEQQMINEIGNK